jgi:hypothetical protein
MSENRISEISEQCSSNVKNQEQNDESNTYTNCEISEFGLEPPIPNWPELHPNALYGLSGEFTDLATENSEADPVAVLLTFLARFGVECGPGPHLMVGDSKHYPRIFSVLVGASSKARKGTSAKPVGVVFNLDELFNARSDPNTPPIKTARCSPGPLSSGEGITNAVRDETKEWKLNTKTGHGKWIVTDPGVEDKRLFILDEEFASALSCTKREGNTLSPIIRNIWDNGAIDPLTKTSKISATGAHIGIVTHITIAELCKMLNETETLNGFANRFLWACVRRSKLVPFPKPMDPGKLYLIQDKLMEIIQTNKNIGRMVFSPQATQRWLLEYEDISKERTGLIGSVLNRAETQVLRLAMLYALLDSSAEIKSHHLDAALAIWTYCEKSVGFIFAGKSEDPTAGRILAALKNGPKSKTELHGIFKRHKRAQGLDVALRQLISQNKIKQRKEATKGAPKTIFELTGP